MMSSGDCAPAPRGGASLSAKHAACWGLLGLLLSSAGSVRAQDPFGDEPIEDEPSADAPESSPDSAPAPAEDAAPEPASEAPPEAAAEGSAEASAEVDGDFAASADLATITTDEVSASGAPAGAAAKKPNVLVTSSHIRRPAILADDVAIIDSPLRVDVYNRDYFQLRRQLGGVALPDTTAALGQGGPGTARFELRLQPTLVMINGRRLVSAPTIGAYGTNFYDTNQIPLQLVERIEVTNGNAAGLYGEDAIGGVVNFITRRDYEGIEVDLGGQATDKFDQGEADVAVTLGAGSKRTGITSMVSYTNRQPLAATDRDWIGERGERIESLLGFPSNFQQATNLDYPLGDPYCQLAQMAGDSAGYEVRLKGYGPPENLSQLKPEIRERLLMNHDVARGDGDGMIEELETSTYCAANYTPNQDLILKDERIQAYSTLWHKFSDHTEAFGEVGYYRSENENRTAPAFPSIRLTPDIHDLQPVLVPVDHADQPTQARGFATAEVQMGRVPNSLFIVGRTQGPFNGDGINERRVDVFRGVLGLQGDFAGLAPNSIVGTWDWDLAATYTTSESLSRVQDTLLDKLADALASCPKSAGLDADSNPKPTTIKQRQEMGCFNPFYSSVTNNIALDPLNLSNARVSNDNGFITSDSDKPGSDDYGVQDGGYICDPADPTKPCPAQFDRNGDGIFELAGTPNTKEVIDRITGEQITYQRRTLALLDGNLRGDLASFADGGLSFDLGGEYRREGLVVDHDQAYNERGYAFLFGGPDIDLVHRDVIAGYAELRLRVLNGLIELQPAARAEIYDTVGTALNPMVGVALRPLAAASTPPAALEWLLLRGHFGQSKQPPSLIQLYGSQNEFEQVDFRGSTLFIPHAVGGNDDLDFETYTTISGGLQWDFAGIHLGADFWTTKIQDMIAVDNSRTLVSDCWQQFQAGRPECEELKQLRGTQTLDHVESQFGNIAEVDTNGIDGAFSYTLDTKKRGLGDIGTFVLGVQGSYINSYLISSPRALPRYYRTINDGNVAAHTPPDAPTNGGYPVPVFNADGSRDYSGLTAEYEAAGWRNYDNFAPPIPQLRFSAPVRWMISGHTIGVTARYVDGYNDDSEYTIEERNLPGIDRIESAVGEAIPSLMVFDAMYAFAFGDDDYKMRLAIGVLNIADAAPPAVQGPLGYEVGIHDPRGRVLYLRATGDF